MSEVMNMEKGVLAGQNIDWQKLHLKEGGTVTLNGYSFRVVELGQNQVILKPNFGPGDNSSGT